MRGAGPLPLPCEVAGDQIVIAGRVLKHLRGQLLPECGCHRTGFERVQHPGVVAGIHDHQHVRVIFGGGTQHGRTTDINVLDGLFKGAIGFGDGGFEWIEIDHEDVNGADRMLLHLGNVLEVAATAQQSTVDFGMQRLDPPVQNFWRTGVGCDIGDGEAGVPQDLRGAAGGEDFPTQGCQPSGQVHDSHLVRDADQCAFQPGHPRASHDRRADVRKRRQG